jgi:hypothetical protein
MCTLDAHCRSRQRTLVQHLQWLSSYRPPNRQFGYQRRPRPPIQTPPGDRGDPRGDAGATRCDPPNPGGLAQTQERCFLLSYESKPKQSESLPTVTLTPTRTIVMRTKRTHVRTQSKTKVILSPLFSGPVPPDGQGGTPQDSVFPKETWSPHRSPAQTDSHTPPTPIAPPTPSLSNKTSTENERKRSKNLRRFVLRDATRADQSH